MMAGETNDEALGLSALGWALGDDARASRFLALTGLTPEGLRTALSERSTLAAVLRFLEAHEPDLIACAADLSIDPAEIAAARRRLEK
ncbi:MAG: DUF3572 domain-containing protein [Sphingosinicella sp.]